VNAVAQLLASIDNQTLRSSRGAMPNFFGVIEMVAKSRRSLLHAHEALLVTGDYQKVVCWRGAPPAGRGLGRMQRKVFASRQFLAAVYARDR